MCEDINQNRVVHYFNNDQNPDVDVNIHWYSVGRHILCLN